MSVVIFLCGVLVGRGVRAEQDAVLAAAEADVMPSAMLPAGEGAPAGEADTPAEVRAEALSYPDRLDGGHAGYRGNLLCIPEKGD